MDDYGSTSAAAGGWLVMMIIWMIISLGIFVWFLWAMARLFPYIGLKSSDGWIPVWNVWRLLERAGLPGWVVLLGFIGLGIVPFILLIIAMHRINTQYGVGVGYTVLGVFIAPLWAMLLANHIMISRGGVQAGYPLAQSGAFAAPPQQDPYLQAPQFQTQHSGSGGTAGVPPWGAAQPIAAPNHPAASNPSAPLGNETEAEYGRLAAETFVAPPAVPLGEVPAPNPFSWTAASRAEVPPAPPVVPPAPPVHPLAAAVPPAQPAPAAPPAAAAVPSVPPAPPAPQAVAATPPAPPVPPSADAMPPAPPAPQAPAAVTAAIQAPAPAAATATSVFAPPAERTPPAPAAFKPTGITGRFMPEPIVDTGAAPDLSPVEDHDYADDFDHTIVVPRSAPARWLLELPDGSQIALEHDNIIGRKPEPVDGANVVAVPDLTRTLSKSHARLTFDGAEWFVTDLGSTNGVILRDNTGREIELQAHAPVPATTEMVFGTLEVRLCHITGAE